MLGAVAQLLLSSIFEIYLSTWSPTTMVGQILDQTLRKSLRRAVRAKPAWYRQVGPQGVYQCDQAVGAERSSVRIFFDAKVQNLPT